MDDDFEMQLHDQTGLEHILWIEEIPVSTSFSGGVSTLESISSETVAMNGRTSQRFFERSSVPYYAAHIPLDENGLKAEVVLDVTDIFAARTRLAGILIASILGISLVGSIFGYFAGTADQPSIGAAIGICSVLQPRRFGITHRN